MTASIRKTTNYALIERLDTKIFGEEETSDVPVEQTTWFLAIVDGKVAGFAGLTPFTEGGVRYGFLERAGLLREFRGRGIQKQLILVRDREAARMGLTKNYTYTAGWNCASANSLIKCGYKLYQPQDNYGIRGAIYFCKTLKGAK